MLHKVSPLSLRDWSNALAKLHGSDDCAPDTHKLRESSTQQWGWRAGAAAQQPAARCSPPLCAHQI